VAEAADVVDAAGVSGGPDVPELVDVEAVDADALPASSTLEAGMALVWDAALLAGDDT
jgi:hypothetical protein